ncbi:MAG TPA: hypothetical protein VJL56_04130, partial [Candidatus Bathyarchaeia archaeon]|nr:hypothetical protein [Candidatus Bathyarchaeia archaeon]
TDWTCGAKVLKHTPFSKRDFCGLAWIMGEFRDSGHDSCLEGGARIVSLTNGSTRFVASYAKDGLTKWRSPQNL